MITYELLRSGGGGGGTAPPFASIRYPPPALPPPFIIKCCWSCCCCCSWPIIGCPYSLFSRSSPISPATMPAPPARLSWFMSCTIWDIIWLALVLLAVISLRFSCDRAVGAFAPSCAKLAVFAAPFDGDEGVLLLLYPEAPPPPAGLPGPPGIMFTFCMLWLAEIPPAFGYPTECAMFGIEGAIIWFMRRLCCAWTSRMNPFTLPPADCGTGCCCLDPIVPASRLFMVLILLCDMCPIPTNIANVMQCWNGLAV
uniref:Uncharacterized protein n=1 Tax=Anopheles atroparvus TaxID=41427 RepID=A0A182J4H1_ANOAO